ncbi:MAG: polysaccharide biosynthesis tyrosine autokinase [Verrucomicrobia bacterium]|nr:polysaccharide biosynthesis tyrosine autokinase [Verrucomicrobiota bacterium]
MDQPKGLIPAAAAPGLNLQARVYRYLRLLRRTWWVVALCVIGAVCWQSYAIYGEAPSYRSDAKMWVSGKVAVPEASSWREELQNFFGTQSELLRSDRLKGRTRERLRILKPNLAPGAVDFRVNVLPRTAVFVLMVIGSEPEYTKAFLDQHMSEYLNYKKELRNLSAEEALKGITEQLYAPRKELEDATEKKLEFARQNDMTSLNDQGGSAAAQLGKNTTRLADLRSELQLLELLIANSDRDAAKMIESSASPETKSKVDTAALTGFQKAKEQLQLARAERADWARYLKPRHPRIMKMDLDISRLEQLLEIYRQQSREQLTDARDSVKVQIQSVQQAVAEWTTKAQEANRKMADYEKLKAGEDRQRALFEKLLNMAQSIGTSKNLEQENVSVMENASTAAPVKASVIKRILTAFFIGLALGVGIIWFVDRNDDRITGVSDLMEAFDLPTMGLIPEMRGRKGELELVHSHDERHSFVEAFRDIRSAILFSTPRDALPKTILITSAVPNEGKSSVSANLAVTLAISGSRVLLVDADLRCGTLHKHFGVAAEPGLHEALTDQVHHSEIIKQTGTPNLSLISCGKPALIAGELFLHPNTEKFISEVCPHYDFVIFDSAPVLATADTTSLAPKIDGVLLVLRSGFTATRLARSALDLLRQRKVNVLGCILNRADPQFPGYYQYKYTKYYHRQQVPA